jgi:hypothetical protein
MAIGNLRRPYLVIASAWLLHAVSWSLPVVRLGGNHARLFGPAQGWFAFRVALSAVWPYEDMHFDAWYYAALSTLSAATTLLFIVGSPWVVWRGSRPVQNACAWAAAVAFVVNSDWYVLFGSDRKDLSIGYFLWWLSFSLLAIGLFGLSKHRKAFEDRQANHAAG